MGHGGLTIPATMPAELHWEYLLILLVGLAVVTAIVAVVVGAVALVVLAARTRVKRERVGVFPAHDHRSEGRVADLERRVADLEDRS